MRKLVLSLFIVLFTFESGIGQDKPHTLLWAVSGNGLKQASYLFGVKHTANGETLIKRYPIIAEKLSSSDVIVQEIAMQEGQPFLDVNTLFYGGDTTIKNFLPDKDYATILRFITEKSENNKEVIDRVIKMRPQLLALAVGELMSTDSTVKEEIISLDEYLTGLAKKENKKIVGLENALDRSKSLAKTVSDEKAFSMILTRISNLNATAQQPDSDYENLNINYYLNKAIKEDFGGVKERNANWVAQLPALMQHKSCFIAVGADHLKAKTGLISLLRNLGYTVAPLKMGKGNILINKQ